MPVLIAYLVHQLSTIKMVPLTHPRGPVLVDSLGPFFSKREQTVKLKPLSSLHTYLDINDLIT